MKFPHNYEILSLVVAILSSCLPLAQADSKPVRILLVGDSTMCDYKADSPINGWGQYFPDHLQPTAIVLNRAVGGSSTKSFLEKGLWKRAIAEKPDFVFIQFGQNDRLTRSDVHTDPATTFRDNLRQLVREAREAGATPVLLTPVANRIFREGKLHTQGIMPWTEAVRAVAAELNVPLLDHHALVAGLYESLGESGAADLATDRTHFTPKGAKTVAALLVPEIPKSLPDLAPHLKSPTP
jgi:lysophospholipase L1-like esterase